jgi:hypothetical protein
MEENFVTVLIVGFFILGLSGAAVMFATTVLRPRRWPAPLGSRVFAFRWRRPAPSPSRCPLGLATTRDHAP